MRLLIAIAVAFLVCNSCQYESIKYTDSGQQINFEKEIQPIFNTSCIACHNGIVAPLDLRENVAFKNLQDAGFLALDENQKNRLLEKLRKPHPESGVPSPIQLNTIENWIKQMN